MKICLATVKYEGQLNRGDITFNSLFIYAHAVWDSGGSPSPHRNFLQIPPSAVELSSCEMLVPEAGARLFSMQDFYQGTCDIQSLAFRKKGNCAVTT